jgi:hypothetical protein
MFVANHTPGPWALVEGDDNGDIYVEADPAHRYYISNMEGSCGHCHADARLIAAAPDMLDALIELAAAFRAVCRAYGQDHDTVSYTKAIDAIRKAAVK